MVNLVKFALASGLNVMFVSLTSEGLVALF